MIKTEDKQKVDIEHKNIKIREESSSQLRLNAENSYKEIFSVLKTRNEEIDDI